MVHLGKDGCGDDGQRPPLGGPSAGHPRGRQCGEGGLAQDTLARGLVLVLSLVLLVYPTSSLVLFSSDCLFYFHVMSIAYLPLDHEIGYVAFAYVQVFDWAQTFQLTFDRKPSGKQWEGPLGSGGIP